MKTNIIKKSIVLGTVLIGALVSSCSDEFLDRPPLDTFSADEFYKTEDQVAAATNYLYSGPWYEYVTNVSWTIGELASGNGRTWDGRNSDFDKFAVTGEHNTMGQAWTSLYAVVGQCNAVINDLPSAAGANIPEATVNSVVGEARVMRALAYFYLVRIYGSVPIIEDNAAIINENYLPRNTVDDIYTFIKNDIQYGIDNITNTKTSEPGRISSNGAKALKAKVHLTREEYQDAYTLSSEVIASGEFNLMSNYDDLFLVENDNNTESIIALQWTNTGEYGEGNGVQSLYALPGITGLTDGWAAIGPSADLQEEYEDKVLDTRFKATIMEPNSFYPNLNGGYTAPDQDQCNAQSTLVAVKKYVVGTPASIGGGDVLSYPNNTYMLRFADVLLIQAEAIIRGGVGTIGEAETAINRVRMRAGLDPITNPDFEAVFHERRIELAFEMEHWFDAIRRDDATAYLSSKERGFYFQDEGGDYVLGSLKYTVTEDKLLFPYPTNETINNPALLDPPVPYY